MFLDMVNKFGEDGGFENILKVIGSPNTSLTHIFYIVDLLSKCQRMYHKSFVDNYFQRLADTIEEKIVNTTLDQLKAVRKERIEELIEKVWKTLLLRLHDSTSLEIIRGKVIIRMGIFMMKQPFLPNKIDGARMIDEVCKNVLMLDRAEAIQGVAQARKMLIEILKEADVLNLYFSSKNIHE